MKPPRVEFARVDWRSARDALYADIVSRPTALQGLVFSKRQSGPSDRSDPLWRQLNAATSVLYPQIAASTVPVLLPFDTSAYLADRLLGAPLLSHAHYQAGFSPPILLHTGPAGYEAIFNMPRDAPSDLPRRTFNKPVEIAITGSRITYIIPDKTEGRGDKVKSLAEAYPDLRRFVREGYLRYAFTRHGVAYVVAIQCLDGAARSYRLACREAAPVAERFLKALKIAGGTPRPALSVEAPTVPNRPDTPSPDFTYRLPGDIIGGTGYRNNPGYGDWTVYAQIRFPLEHGPAYANSQSFLNWGDCYQKGRIPVPHRKGQPYRCKLNDKPLVFDESAGENYAYPWRDNFCETRDLNVGMCPGGYGHQGQDIRPATCEMRNEGADRCIPSGHKLVAVRDGVIVRTGGQQAAFVLVNETGEHLKFRYMHMVPTQMDNDGVTHGREVHEGEIIGTMSNYQDRLGGTTTHLHFDIQVFTRDGWTWVSPYMTLISAYERLIGARGALYVPPVPSPGEVAKANGNGHGNGNGKDGEPAADQDDKQHPEKAD